MLENKTAGSVFKAYFLMAQLEVNGYIFSGNNPAFFVSLILRWMEGRVRGEQLLKNLLLMEQSL